MGLMASLVFCSSMFLFVLLQVLIDLMSRVIFVGLKCILVLIYYYVFSVVVITPVLFLFSLYSNTSACIKPFIYLEHRYWIWAFLSCVLNNMMLAFHVDMWLDDMDYSHMVDWTRSIRNHVSWVLDLFI